MTITPQHIRDYASLPMQVPEALLQSHIDIALRDLVRLTGRETMPEGQAEQWREAASVRALASVFPWLNTFALEGAAKVGRLEGAVEYRFVGPDEVDERIRRLDQRFEELISLLQAPTENEQSSATGFGAFSLIAI